MKKSISKILGTLLPCVVLLGGASLDASNIERPLSIFQEGPRVKVLLADKVKSGLLEVKGEFRVLRADTGELLSFGGSKRFAVHGKKEGLRWGEEYLDVYQIKVVPVTSATMMYLDGIQYSGIISLYQDHDMKLTIVNEVPIEEFLQATLATRGDFSHSKEALAAFAIAARTDALQRIAPQSCWDVRAEDMGYFGHGMTRANKEMEDAIAKTNHMVMDAPPGAFAGVWRQEKSGNGFSRHNVEELAERGYDARRILQNYFPEAKIALFETPSRSVR